MPARVPRACRERGCAGRTTERHGYCEQHAHKAKAWVRSKRNGRGGSRWQKLRGIVQRRADGLCEHCKRRGLVTVGSECDHITNVAEGGTDALENLQWLCKPCHAAKTKEESRRGAERAGGRGG